MKKLIKGIVEFRKKQLPAYRETFANLALGQKPDVLYIGCSDSRVAVNVFASTDPGDLFVNRNVGNMVPPCCNEAFAGDGVSAAIEFALHSLTVKDIIICGHSECGAMRALMRGIEQIQTKGLKAWLNHGKEVLDNLNSEPEFAKGQAPHNRLSQLNVLKQMEHLKTYPIVKERLSAGQLSIHGWWFEISRAEVFYFNDKSNSFELIEEENSAAKFIEKSQDCCL